ncbi:transposase [gut metagenome]|uniref:Transposase n=1 Tax=gut metagenome TaxID=749906 RepID=J9GMS7_9ZZZZ
MATFKIITKNRRADGFMYVFIRVIHNRESKLIRTNKMVTDSGVSHGEVTDPFVVKYCMNKIFEYQDMLNRVEADIQNWTCQNVVDYLKSSQNDLCFSDYARKHIERMHNDGHVRNSRNYQLALQHMERYFGTTKIMFSQLTSANVIKWIQSLNKTARAKEMYPVCMRQVFKAAVMELNDYDTGVMRIKTNPWMKAKIPVADRPEKRAISAEDCRAFFAAPLPETKMLSPLPELGRDVAMMCLCLAGINTVDLYQLKKTDYYNGIIHYQRAKTRNSRADNAYIEMRVPEVIKPLFEKYALEDDSDEYLFCFHKRHSSSDSFCANVNTGIRKICESMGLPKEHWYCVYTFRHTWATTAQNDCGANIAEVGFAMNHSQRSVTRTYVKIDFTPAWELNEKVVNFILFSDQRSKLSQHNDVQSQLPEQFRVTPKMLIRAAAFFQGKLLASFEDIGCANVDDVLARLVAELPATIPNRSNVQFKIVNMDNGNVAVYEKMKGKGF